MHSTVLYLNLDYWKPKFEHVSWHVQIFIPPKVSVCKGKYHKKNMTKRLIPMYMYMI